MILYLIHPRKHHKLYHSYRFIFTKGFLYTTPLITLFIVELCCEMSIKVFLRRLKGVESTSNIVFIAYMAKELP